jgi:hypothetical protein
MICWLIISGCNIVNLGRDATKSKNQTTLLATGTSVMQETLTLEDRITTTNENSTKNDLAHTPKPTITSTPTPIPSLSEDEANELSLELLLDNGGCIYPCFLGRITPGTSIWSDVENFLKQLNIQISEASNDRITYYRARLPISDEELEYIDFLVRDGILRRIFVHFPTTPMDIFSTYGAPLEIWLSIIPPNYGVAPYHLVFFYPRNGFYASFEGAFLFEMPEEPEFYSLCESTLEDAHVGIDIWSTRGPVELEDVYSFFDFHDVNFRRLKDVSNLNETSYYEAISTQNEDVCILLNAEIWR